MKETKVSRTDPDSGYMVRDGKPKGFFYLDHRTVDGRHAIITDTHVTPANVHDSIVYLERLDRQRERFDLAVGAVGLDAGHGYRIEKARAEDQKTKSAVKETLTVQVCLKKAQPPNGRERAFAHPIGGTRRFRRIELSPSRSLFPKIRERECDHRRKEGKCGGLAARRAVP
ncbi:hypothetical protein ABID21_002235 [Pseudorhizobium tarimense]|uniref:Transposase DDE domain-containing protein n=1 Tax=Pseudorhizobium tarimense TaxID=1079109 RepID=A0ABV2H6F1_9HYPH